MRSESETNFGMAADIFHEVLKSTSESDNWKESNKRIILQFSQLRVENKNLKEESATLRDDLAKVTKEQQEQKSVLMELAHRMEQLKVPFSNDK